MEFDYGTDEDFYADDWDDEDNDICSECGCALASHEDGICSRCEEEYGEPNG